jgi:phosphatidylcholine synthase
MKTADRSFLGFPGCWNMVVLVLFTVTPPPAMTMAVLVPLAAAMFLPLKFIHPVRTARWRPLSLPVALLWLALALLAVLSAFEVGSLAQSVLIGASLYLLGAGLLQQLLDRRKVGLR